MNDLVHLQQWHLIQEMAGVHLVKLLDIDREEGSHLWCIKRKIVV